jgi:hypothetical protein
MFKIETKKFMSLALVISLILLTVYSTVTSKPIPDYFVTLTSMIVSYYFGRSHGESNT